MILGLAAVLILVALKVIKLDDGSPTPVPVTFGTETSAPSVAVSSDSGASLEELRKQNAWLSHLLKEERKRKGVTFGGQNKSSTQEQKSRSS